MLLGTIALEMAARYELIPDVFPILRGADLSLRELSEDDLPAWLGRLSDDEAATLAGDPVTSDMQVVIDGLEHHRTAFREKTALRWAIVPDGAKGSIGTMGLGDFSAAAHAAAIGAAIGRARWGEGIATRAARLVIDYGFSTLSLEQVEAVVLPENARVRRVLEKLGFARVAEPIVADREIGARSDTLVFRASHSST